MREFYIEHNDHRMEHIQCISDSNNPIFFLKNLNYEELIRSDNIDNVRRIISLLLLRYSTENELGLFTVDSEENIIWLIKVRRGQTKNFDAEVIDLADENLKFISSRA